MKVTDQTSATTNRNEKAKRVISFRGKISCVSLWDLSASILIYFITETYKGLMESVISQEL